MKFSTTLLALVTSAFANELGARGYKEGTTLTTYTTVTTCPVTSTYTKEGSTYCVTQLTTSTIVVTECHGCGVTTVQGPDVTKTEVDTVYTTRTTVCPITTTQTIGGKETTLTLTATQVIKENKYTTITVTQQLPDQTHTDVVTDYKTYTSVYPTTVTTTIAGKETIVTLTATEIIKENKYTTIIATQQLPDQTHTAVVTDYKTYTNVYPTTVTTTIAGKETIVTLTATQIVKENEYTTIAVTEKLPDVTKTEVDTAYSTTTALHPVTTTETIGGQVVTKVYTETQVIKQNAYTTITVTQELPDVTKTEVDTAYITSTSLCPVTVTQTIGGKVVTKVYTETQVIKQNAYTTITVTEQLPDVTKTEVDTAYSTYTSLCPVTETITAGGKEITKVYTSTQIIKENAYTKIYVTEQLPDVTETAVQVEHSTITSLYPVTEVTTINGERTTLYYTSTEVIVTQIPTVIKETKVIPGYTQTEFEVAQSTITSLCPVTETETVNGEVVTKIYTSTQVIVQQVPTTIEAVQTIYKTAEGQEVETQYSKVYVTVGGGTVYLTQQAPPKTIVAPETSIVQVPPVTVTTAQQAPAQTTPVQVPTGAANVHEAPAVAFVAGVIGLLAIL